MSRGKKKQGDACGGHKERENHQRDPDGVLAREIKAIREQLLADREQPSPYERKQYRLASATLWVAAIYAALTLGIFCASKRAADATKKAADAAADAALAAAESNGLSRRAMQEADRAWVLVKETSGLRPPREPADWILMLRNYGKSPARYVVTRAEMRVAWRQRIGEVGEPVYTQAQGTPVLPPDKDHPVMMKPQRDIPAGYLQAVYSGEPVRGFKATFYVRARIDYADQFSRNRATKFCLYYRPEGDAFTFCNGGNGAK